MLPYFSGLLGTTNEERILSIKAVAMITAIRCTGCLTCIQSTVGTSYLLWTRIDVAGLLELEHLKIHNFRLLNISAIVFAWLRSHHSRFETLVAIRLALNHER